VSVSWASFEITLYQQWDNATSNWFVIEVHQRPCAQICILFERGKQELGDARIDTFNP
jgi:hypothetical protein